MPDSVTVSFPAALYFVDLAQLLQKILPSLPFNISVSVPTKQKDIFIYTDHVNKPTFYISKPAQQSNRLYKIARTNQKSWTGIAQSVQRLATSWMVRGSNPDGGRDLSHLSRSFPVVKSGQGVTLTFHRVVVPRSRKSIAILLLHHGSYGQYRAACTRVHFTFYLIKNQFII